MANRTTKVIEELPNPVRLRLLQFARRVLESTIAGEVPPAVPPIEELENPGSAFVTLRRGGELRGCIGDTSFRNPLGEVVERMTIAAATSDPRFTPISPIEVSEVTIEISRLAVPVPATVGDVEPGRHGVIVQKGSYRGLLLPQVAAEFGCDGPAFVALACKKAGLPATAVTDPDLDIRTFEAEVFGE